MELFALAVSGHWAAQKLVLRSNTVFMLCVEHRQGWVVKVAWRSSISIEQFSSHDRSVSCDCGLNESRRAPGLPAGVTFLRDR